MDINDKILSIIIPSYNMELYLDKCLKSILNPLQIHLEIIVVNDGSKDSTSEIAHRFSDQFPDIFKIIDKPNGNYGSCINVGINNATGKYIKVLDADDCLETNNLESFIQFLLNTDCDLIITNRYIVNEEDEITAEWHPFGLTPKSVVTFKSVGSSLRDWRFQMHAVTYRTSILKDLDYKQLEGISYTDQQWMFLPMSRVKTLAYFDKPLYRYLVGREGQTINSDAYVKNSAALYQISEQLIEDYNKISNPSSYFRSRLCQILNTTYYIHLIKKGDKKSVDLIKSLDLKLRHHNDVYDELAEEKLLKPSFKFIKYWRRFHRRDGLGVFGLIRLLSNLKRNTHK